MPGDKLCDGDEPIADYRYVERNGNRVITEITLHVPVARAAAVFLREFGGHRIAGSPELGRALEAGGAIPSRHAHRYEHPGSAAPPELPPGITLAPYDGRDLTAVYRSSGAEWDEPAVPEALIPEASAIALAGAQVAGAILVGDEDRLIFDVFRDPAFPGTGKALIQHALNAGPLTLVVTDGNPAERLYRRLGFRHVDAVYSVDLE